MLVAGSASAATINVDNSTVNAISNAVSLASAGDTLNLSAGTYYEHDITIDKNLTITGPVTTGEPTAVIDAQQQGRIFYKNSGVTVNLQYLTITNGTGNYGGGIYNYGGTCTITNCTITNGTGNYGGGIYNYGGTCTITNCTITQNIASDGGGGIENEQCIRTITNCTITQNIASVGFGGGIENWYGTCTITDSTITQNTVYLNGGGIYNTGSCTVTNCTITQNTANRGGGGIYNNGGTCTVSGSTITGNTAIICGGGIYNSYGILNLSGSAVTGNTATTWGTGLGGGIYNDRGTLTVSGCDFAYNRANGNGNAIYNIDGDSSNRIINFNRFYDPFEGYEIYSYSGTVDAKYNWLGSNTTPISKVYGSVDVSPWLILSIDANPDILRKNDSSNITANLWYDSDKNYHDPTDGHIIDGLSVIFETATGTINTPISTSNGSAVSTLTAGTVTGLFDVSAILDDQMVQTSVYIDAAPPTVSAIDPENNAVINNTSKIVTVTFNELVQKGSTYNDISITYNGTPVSVVTSLNGNILTITNTGTYNDGTYIINIPADAVIDTMGNAINTYTSQFTVDTVAPIITDNDPVNGAVINDTSKVVTVTFSKDIQEGTAFDDITIILEGKVIDETTTIPDKILTTITKTINGNVLSLTNTASYVDGKYTVNIPVNAVVDEAGNGLATSFSSVFTVDTVAPTVTGVDPVDGTVLNDTTKEVTVTFSKNIIEGTAFDDISISLNGTPLTTITKTITGNVLTLTNTASYADGTYTVNIPVDAVVDEAGNALETAFSSVFTIDTVAPTVTSVDPADGAVINDTGKVVTVTFSEDILEGTGFDDISISLNGTPLTTITKAITGNVLTLTNTASYADGTYTVNIPVDAVVDEAGNALESSFSSLFTVDTVAPVITSTDPVNGATNLFDVQVITVTFSEDIKWGTSWIELLDRSNDTAVDFTSAINGNILTITPTNELTEALYKVIVHTGSVTDMAGNMVAVKSFYFSVGTSPTITSTTPLDGATNVNVAKTITVTFSEAIRKSSHFWVELVDSSGNAVAYTSYITGGNMLVIDPTVNLAAGTTYKVKLHTGCVTDLAGNPVAPYIFSFTTRNT